MESFEKINKHALQLNQVATQDYLACRRCLMNGHTETGYILASQALEKMLKAHILLILPNEKIKKSKNYPFHDLIVLLDKLQTISQLKLDPFKNLCFVLTKAHFSFRYPDNPHIVTYGIRSISTAVIDEVDEMFLYLFENLPVPDQLKCRIGLLGHILITKDSRSLECFIQTNKAYAKRLNYFGKPLNWWLMNQDDRKKLPSISILSINGIDCNS